jgi:hypothetical protein
MERYNIQRDKTYTLFELSDRSGLRVAEVHDLVHKGKLNSHYTDNTEVVNGKDFLQWAEQQEGARRIHYE